MSCLSTAAMLEIPIGKNAVVRTEKLARASMLSQAQLWYKECYQAVDSFFCRLAEIPNKDQH